MIQQKLAWHFNDMMMIASSMMMWYLSSSSQLRLSLERGVNCWWFIMTTGRSLVDAGLYQYDKIVTDFTFSTFIMTLFGLHRKSFKWVVKINIFRTCQAVQKSEKWPGTEASVHRQSTTSLRLHHCGWVPPTTNDTLVNSNWDSPTQQQSLQLQQLNNKSVADSENLVQCLQTLEA